MVSRRRSRKRSVATRAVTDYGRRGLRAAGTRSHQGIRVTKCGQGPLRRHAAGDSQGRLRRPRRHVQNEDTAPRRTMGAVRVLRTPFGDAQPAISCGAGARRHRRNRRARGTLRNSLALDFNRRSRLAAERSGGGGDRDAGAVHVICGPVGLSATATSSSPDTLGIGDLGSL